MCKLFISVKNNYVILKIKNKTIKCLTSPVLEKYTAVNSFSKKDGVISLKARFNLLNGDTVEDDDWIDLNEDLAFAFRNPEKIINEIDTIMLT